MIDELSELQLQNAKDRSRGVSCDMSPAAVLRRLDIVDELRELAMELQNAKRLGPLKADRPAASAAATNAAIASPIVAD